MRCPECGSGMEEFQRGDRVIRTYGACKICKYTCSADFVSGYWNGVKSADKWKKENRNG